MWYVIKGFVLIISDKDHGFLKSDGYFWVRKVTLVFKYVNGLKKAIGDVQRMIFL